MRVKFNGETSEEYDLVGGGPQGTLLGLLEYLVQSNDNANCVEKEDRFKYIDDLTILEVLCLTGILKNMTSTNMFLQMLELINYSLPLINSRPRRA